MQADDNNLDYQNVTMTIQKLHKLCLCFSFSSYGLSFDFCKYAVSPTPVKDLITD